MSLSTAFSATLSAPRRLLRAAMRSTPPPPMPGGLHSACAATRLAYHAQSQGSRVTELSGTLTPSGRLIGNAQMPRI